MTGKDRGRTLVLGGGGVTGMAWTTGLLLGLEERGLNVRAFDRVIGTSAGATVGAQLGSELSLSDLYDRQTDPALQVDELTPDVRYLRLIAGMVPALLARGDRGRLRRRVGALALKADTAVAQARRDVIARRLPSHGWGKPSLTVVAIDAASGGERCLDASSGVALLDAVAASCAVPGIWPTVSIGGREHYDGGVPSPDNAHLAAGSASVLIVSPMGGARAGGLGRRLRSEVEELERGGSRVTVLVPDAGSREAMGRRALDPSRRRDAARAGRTQGAESGGSPTEVGS